MWLLDIELRMSGLAAKHHYPLNHLPASFVHFLDSVLLFWPGLSLTPDLLASTILGTKIRGCAIIPSYFLDLFNLNLYRCKDAINFGVQIFAYYNINKLIYLTFLGLKSLEFPEHENHIV